MKNKFRIETDKLQILSEQLADTICLYFKNANTSTIQNLTHACNNLTKDISKCYVRRGEIPKIKFLSNMKEFKDVSSYGLTIGNNVKHASRDTDIALNLTWDKATQYLLLSVLDFQQLKDSLIKHGLAHKTNAFQYIKGNKAPKTTFGDIFLSNRKLYRESYWAIYNSNTRIDGLSSLLWNWHEHTEPKEDPFIKTIKEKTTIPFRKTAFGKLLTLEKRFLELKNAFRFTNMSEEELSDKLRHDTYYYPGLLIKLAHAGIGSDSLRRKYYLGTVNINGNIREGSIPQELYIPSGDRNTSPSKIEPH